MCSLTCCDNSCWLKLCVEGEVPLSDKTHKLEMGRQKEGG